MPDDQTVGDFLAAFDEAAGIQTQTPTEPEVDTVEEPEAAPVTEASEPEPEPETPTEVLLAGKYKTVEELERGYQEAQAHIGRQGAELGEARQIRQEFDRLSAELKAAQPQPQYDPNTVEDTLTANPQLIPQYAEQALQRGDAALYAQAMRAWQDQDPLGAADFHTRKLIEASNAELQAQLAPVQQATQRAEVASQFQQAFQTKVQEHPDFADVMNSITPEAIQGFPKAVVAALETGDAQTKVEVLETLYRWTKAEQAGTLTQAAIDAATATRSEAQQARQEAVVASAAASSDRTPQEKTPIQQFHENFEASVAFRKAAGLA